MYLRAGYLGDLPVKLNISLKMFVLKYVCMSGYHDLCVRIPTLLWHSFHSNDLTVIDNLE